MNEELPEEVRVLSVDLLVGDTEEEVKVSPMPMPTTVRRGISARQSSNSDSESTKDHSDAQATRDEIASVNGNGSATGVATTGTWTGNGNSSSISNPSVNSTAAKLLKNLGLERRPPIPFTGFFFNGRQIKVAAGGAYRSVGGFLVGNGHVKNSSSLSMICEHVLEMAERGRTSVKLL